MNSPDVVVLWWCPTCRKIRAMESIDGNCFLCGTPEERRIYIRT